MLLPLRTSTPEPLSVSPSVLVAPSVNWPLKVVAEFWLTVNTELAEPLLVIVPAAPLRLATVGLKPARSMVP